MPWLAKQEKEPILELELPIIDTHPRPARARCRRSRRTLHRTSRLLRPLHLSAPGAYGRAFAQIAASDLDVPVLGQLTPPQLSLGGSLEACSLQVVSFEAALGDRGIRQQALEHAPRYPYHAVVFADFNSKLNSLPVGIPSGKVKNIGAFVETVSN
jgi:hypothetical protein